MLVWHVLQNSQHQPDDIIPQQQYVHIYWHRVKNAATAHDYRRNRLSLRIYCKGKFIVKRQIRVWSFPFLYRHKFALGCDSAQNKNRMGLTYD